MSLIAKTQDELLYSDPGPHVDASNNNVCSPFSNKIHLPISTVPKVASTQFKMILHTIQEGNYRCESKNSSPNGELKRNRYVYYKKSSHPRHRRSLADSDFSWFSDDSEAMNIFASQ